MSAVSRAHSQVPIPTQKLTVQRLELRDDVVRAAWIGVAGAGFLALAACSQLPSTDAKTLVSKSEVGKPVAEATPRDVIARGVQCVGERSYAVTRAARGEIVLRGIEEVHFVEEFRDGQQVGHRIEKEAFLPLLGLRKGDVLVRVAGITITSYTTTGQRRTEGMIVCSSRHHLTRRGSASPGGKRDK
jgi:hypothetical protein